MKYTTKIKTIFQLCRHQNKSKVLQYQFFQKMKKIEIIKTKTHSLFVW